ncbi:metal ABC transporter solute-binding protein, Zn/Mn family [Sporosarcina limicola]|uniref:Iron/zinc/copper transport system substrate-binding protein n=1 Tax=Sporosarcina limicola TaxID=34101 RepID=A0A927R404_9BACL|nr:zinc ABC transporter substrate-binding protein [Sporosarcina limicola]MBE1554328.1 iron/zinc/copper transport system substrate-binding protein [Sporosarcina limicola]
MKKLILFLTTMIVVALVTACSQGATSPKEKDKGGKLKIVTTYSIVYDMIKNVGGEHVEVHSLAPIGSDPHNYDPLPDDLVLTTDADAVFYNGLNLEEGNAWFNEMIETAGKSIKDDNVIRVSEGVEPMLLSSEEHKNEEDPHAWLDVRNGIKYVENIRDALKKIDATHADDYDKNAGKYIAELNTLHEEILEMMHAVPEEKRVLVTSEGAFKYFSAAYDFQAAYIWEINSHDEGTPEQLKSIISIVKDDGVPSLFLESSVDPRSMEMVSRETGVPIHGKIFTDSLGNAGSDGDTYIKMIKWNAEMIADGLGK